MSKKNKIIIVLLIVGIFMYSTVQFVIIPMNNSKIEKYNLEQSDALTHDIENVLEYKSLYIGDSSNDINLFYHLPLNNISTKFQINSVECSLTVRYLEDVGNIGEEKVHRDLVYNSAAAFSLIDNLTKVNYEFSDNSFSFTREQFENALGKPLSSLLVKSIWSEKIQSKLSDPAFVNAFY